MKFPKTYKDSILNFKIKIHQNGFDDLQNIASYYEDKSIDLGSRFIEQVKLQINSLKSNPERYANRYQDVRCMVVKKFPYIVHYIINSDIFLVEVFAIIHTSRDPKFWQKRILEIQ